MKLNKIEIQLLAEDIRNNINQTIEITKFSITASCAFLGFGLSNAGNQGIIASLICLLPVPILTAAIEMILNRRLNIMRKATFLRKYGGNDYVWEKFLRGLREIKNDPSTAKKDEQSFTKTLLNTLLASIKISFIVSVLVLLYRSTNMIEKSIPELITAVSCFIIIISTAIFFKKYLYKKWNNVEQFLMGGEAEDKIADNWAFVEDKLIKNGDLKNSNPITGILKSFP